MLGAFETRTLNNYPNIRDDEYEDLMQERIEKRREVCMYVQLELANGFYQDVDLAESSMVFIICTYNIIQCVLVYLLVFYLLPKFAFRV